MQNDGLSHVITFLIAWVVAFGLIGFVAWVASAV